MSYEDFTNLSEVINGRLKSLSTQLGNDAKKIENMMLQHQAAITSNLGIELNANINGIKSLTQQIDDVIPSFANSLVQNVDGRFDIAAIEEAIPQLQEKMLPALDAAKSDLQAITGAATAATEKALNVIISSGAPEAINAALKEKVGALSNELKSITSEITNIDKLVGIGAELDIASALEKVTDGVFDSKLSLDNIKVSTMTDALKSAQSTLSKLDQGLNGVLNNALEQHTGNITSKINSILKNEQGLLTVDPKQLKSIVSLVDTGAINDAVKLAQKVGSTLPVENITEVLGSINTSLSGQIAKPSYAITPKPLRTQPQSAQALGTTDAEFSYVITEEELIVELKSFEREVTETIITWTGTRLDQNLDARQIDNIFKQTGKSIPYHYIIKRDGTLQRGRDIEQPTDSLPNGHEQYSIFIAFVGGVNLASSARTADTYTSNKSLTSAQMKTLDTFIRIAYEAYPGMQMLGHNDIEIGNKAPGFDVNAHTEAKYGKISILDDPSNNGPLSPSLIRTFKSSYTEEAD